MKITECPITSSKQRFTFLDLGNIPLVNNLLESKEESLQCEKFPLAVQYFSESKVTCLTETVTKDSLFLNYLYRSRVNYPFLVHCSKMYAYLADMVDLKDNDLVVDVGGNDGSLLYEFEKENPNLRFLNVDASESFKEENEQKGFTYVNKFFGDKCRWEPEQKAKVIVSTNVFQHTFPMREFVQDIYYHLAHEGVWCLEFPYVLTTLAKNNYDQIYHEHVYYYCLKNIVDLLAQEGMKVINVSYHDMHAGTLRVISCKKTSKRQPDSTINSFLNLEASLTSKYMMDWGKHTEKKIKTFEKFIKDKKEKGFSIAAFGAAAKGCVFLNTCNLNYKHIDYIIDDTEFKQDKFVPGTGIQVVPREVLNQQPHPDYILILAHNFKDHIIDSLKDIYKGKFIIMFPDIQII